MTVFISRYLTRSGGQWDAIICNARKSKIAQSAVNNLKIVHSKYINAELTKSVRPQKKSNMKLRSGSRYRAADKSSPRSRAIINSTGAGPGLQPVAGHITTAVRFARVNFNRGRWRRWCDVMRRGRPPLEAETIKARMLGGSVGNATPRQSRCQTKCRRCFDR